MSKYIRGVKRNQIIQRWLQGIEDPVYDVFPTKKEGKYIVKLRETEPVDSEPETLPVVKSDDSKTEKSCTEIPADVKSDDEEEVHPTPVVKQNKQRQRTSDGNFVPQTINLEILEQLRSLGEEIRNDRFKKEQKQYIKHIVNKELSKSRIRSKYVPDLIPVGETQQPEPEKEPEPEPEPEPQPIFRSRIRRY